MTSAPSTTGDQSSPNEYPNQVDRKHHDSRLDDTGGQQRDRKIQPERAEGRVPP